MPTIPQSKIPIPKSWDEFEDIVADLYTRLWNDSNTRRYGRFGQAQQGVNIYGCPAPLQGRYAGVQCKRYAEDTLTRKTVEREIVKAEEFTPALAEYTIATTERRDAKIQQAVREISQQRQAAGKFPVHVTFWEELCGLLCHPDNDDLLRKHYYEWLQRFGEPSAHLPIWNIPHTLPSHKLSPRDLAAVPVAGRARRLRTRRAPGRSRQRTGPRHRRLARGRTVSLPVQAGEERLEAVG